MALSGHNDHPVLDGDGNIVYHKVMEFLFGENVRYFNNAYRRNAKYCASVPCFSKQVYAVNFYSYEYDGGCLDHGSRYSTYGMGFDLLTVNNSEKVESFRFDYAVPTNTSKGWSDLDSWRSKVDRKKGEAMECNIHYLCRDLKSGLDHLKKFHNLVFTR